jgi:hypothetical protein
LFVAIVTLAGGGELWWWPGGRHRKRGKMGEGRRVARNAAASTGLSHSEETLRDVGKAGQAKRCWTDWRGSLHSVQAELGERTILAV